MGNVELNGWTFAQVPIELIMDNEVSSTAKVLYAYLVWRQGTDAGCWPSQTKIANDLGLSRDSANRLALELESQGWMNITRRTGRSNFYTINATCGKNATPTCGKNATQNDNQLNDSSDGEISPPQRDTPLAPSAKEEMLLFRELRRNAGMKGFRGPKRFKTYQQRDWFRELAAELNSEFEDALKSALQRGRTDIESICKFLASWVENKKRPRRQGQGEPTHRDTLPTYSSYSRGPQIDFEDYKTGEYADIFGEDAQ